MSEDEWRLIGFTAWAAAAGTLLATAPSLGLAWLLARRSWRGKTLVEALINLPLVMPPVATGLVLLRLAGRRGPLGRLSEQWFGVEIAFTWRAVVIALAVMAAPLITRSARSAFEEVDPRYEAVAQTLGATPWGAFLRVTLPLAARGVVAGMTLGFARALGEFGATVMVAGNIPGRTSTLALAIYQSVQTGGDDRAWRLVAVAAGLSFAAAAASAMLSRRRAW